MLVVVVVILLSFENINENKNNYFCFAFFNNKATKKLGRSTIQYPTSEIREREREEQSWRIRHREINKEKHAFPI